MIQGLSWEQGSGRETQRPEIFSSNFEDLNMAQHPTSDLVFVIIRPVLKELLYSTLTNFYILKTGSENWRVS